MQNGKVSELQKLNEALRESEERFHAIFDLASVGIAQLSLNGRWLLLNQKICDILGYSMDELKVLTVSQVSHPEDMTVHLSELRGMICGESAACSTQKRFVRKDGSVVWANLTVTLVRDHSGEPDYFVAVVEDINERKRAEEELRQSEERFRQIFRLAPIGISISTVEDSRFVDVNEVAERLTGYRRDELIGRRALELNLWADPQQRTGVIREVLTKGEVRDREILMRDKSGRALWVLFSAVLIEVRGDRYLLVLLSDIGEQKRALEALRDSEERFRLVADNAPVLIWEAGPDTLVTFVNRTWLDFTGRSFDQELGEGWTESVHPDDLERCLDTYLTAFHERRDFSLEYRLRRDSGEYGWIVDTGVPRFSGSGEFQGYLGTGFDITEQKLTKEELQQSNRLLARRVEERTAELTKFIERLREEINERVRIGEVLQEEMTGRINAQAELREKELMLLHQGRLAAMGEMIGNIAHQWRQPLNVLSLLIQELAMTWKSGEFDGEYLEKSVRKMRETIQHMSQTISDFSNFFKPSKEKVSFRVLETIERTISLLEGSLKGLQIRTELVPHGDPVLQGFPNELSQVFLNIMNNAKDALAARKVPDPVIVIELFSEGESCVITITDNAGGIPDEILDRIFDPYFTTKPPEQGTGVGLFMSRTIIEKNMGGRISARNVDGGAQFRIEI